MVKFWSSSDDSFDRTQGVAGSSPASSLAGADQWSGARIGDGELTHLDNLLSIKNARIRLVRQPEELVVVSAKNPAGAL